MARVAPKKFVKRSIVLSFSWIPAGEIANLNAKETCSTVPQRKPTPLETNLAPGVSSHLTKECKSAVCLCVFAKV